MCCCGKPTINGEFGYRWNDPNKEAGVYPVNPPELRESDQLLFDEAGRCGGLDSHSHHYRVVRAIGLVLLVRHGRGDERIYLSGPVLQSLEQLDSNGRYWVLNAIFHAHSNAARFGRDTEAAKWGHAAAEKRIRTRKIRGTDRYKVSILQKA